MRLFAHVHDDGTIEGIVAQPEGDAMAMLVPEPGVQVYEITDHGFDGETIEPQELAKLREEYTVERSQLKATFAPRANHRK